MAPARAPRRWGHSLCRYFCACGVRRHSFNVAPSILDRGVGLSAMRGPADYTERNTVNNDWLASIDRPEAGMPLIVTELEGLDLDFPVNTYQGSSAPQRPSL